nr:ATP-binding protein [Gammaproteobacteria bacterium]
MSASLWDSCLSRLETELSELQLNTWIRPLQAYQTDARLCIMAPNRFVLDMVQNNYYPRIQELVASLSDFDELEVELVIGTGAEPTLSPSAASLAQDSPAAAINSSSTHIAVETPHSLGFAPAHSQVASTVTGHDSRLNPLFTFDSLIEGKSNQLGRAAAMQIGSNPGNAYNPFLIYGGSGLGKTHLMQSIGHSIMAQQPDAKVLYLNSERYVAEMVSAIQHSKMNEFKRFYRNLDALLIDDIQFFAGKEQSQEEFFHTFNA